jgi:hypothetical protein
MSLGDQLDLSVTALIAVVVTTAIMYLALVVLLRLWGSRLLVSPASHTMATVVVLVRSSDVRAWASSPTWRRASSRWAPC